MRRLLVSLACFLVGIGWFGIAKPVTAQTIPGDMISPVNASTNCISIEGALDALPAIQPNVCRGLAQQYWQIDTDGRWQTGANTSYCLARKSSGSRNLTVRLCTDPLTLRLQVDPTNSAIYTVVGEDLALDNYGSEVGLWSKHGGTNQQWRWFQDDLNLVNTQGCSITYPFAATDTTTYRQELACDRISRLHPVYRTDCCCAHDHVPWPSRRRSDTRYQELRLQPAVQRPWLSADVLGTTQLAEYWSLRAT